MIWRISRSLTKWGSFHFGYFFNIQTTLIREYYEIKMINFKTVRREGVSTHVKHEHYYHPLDTYDSRLIYFTCILNPKRAQRSPSNWIWHQASNEMLINDSLLSKKLLFFKIWMPISWHKFIKKFLTTVSLLVLF